MIAPHHTALTTALGAEELADITRTELLTIDHTTTRQLTKELRWNQAYHRLAQGF